MRSCVSGSRHAREELCCVEPRARPHASVCPVTAGASSIFVAIFRTTGSGSWTAQGINGTKSTKGMNGTEGMNVMDGMMGMNVVKDVKGMNGTKGMNVVK